MAEDFHLVCCLPTLREGHLAVSAAASVRGQVDDVVIWEGPAGKVSLPAGTPKTEFPPGLGIVAHGRWSSDAEKRTQMVRFCRERWHSKPLWLLWLDADEVVVNAFALRDLVRSRMWQDEVRGCSIAKPDNPPAGGIVLRYVEADGSVSDEWGRLLRGDMIRRYKVSNLIVENVLGVDVRLGRRPQGPIDWRAEVERFHARDGMVVLERPLPGEPHFLHRSHLRHPYRQGLRLHEAEAQELDRLGLAR